MSDQLLTESLCAGCEGDPYTGGDRKLPWHPRPRYIAEHADFLTGYFMALTEDKTRDEIVTMLRFKEAGRREWRRVAASRLRGIVALKRRLRELGDRYSALSAENKRLRAELDLLKERAA